MESSLACIFLNLLPAEKLNQNSVSYNRFYGKCVEAEMNNLPGYYETISGNEPVSVTLGQGSEIWTTSLEDSRSQTSLSLPQDLEWARRPLPSTSR